MDSAQQHWDNVYSTKAENEVSWFQPYPKTSVEFIELAKLPKSANIIDIGGGDSHLTEALLDKVIKTFLYLIFLNMRLKGRNKDWAEEL